MWGWCIGYRDVAGNAMVSPYVWTFTTGDGADLVAPLVTSTTPANNAVAVALNAPVSATFSEVMNPTTVSATTFTVRDGTTAVPGTVLYTGVTAIFTPTNGLVEGTVYTATIAVGAADLAGNALAAPYVWTFTTGADVDTTAPAVTFTTPANAATATALNALVSATFSEVMDPTTVTNGTFTLNDGTAAVLGTVVYTGVTAIFTPDAVLLAGTTYTATITVGAKDLAGNALVDAYTWTFTTGLGLDTLAPTVTSTTPANAATATPRNNPISATFSEVMNPSTVTTSTFTLHNGAVAVPGTVIYTGVTAIFTPTNSLVSGTLYTGTISVAAKDLAGNPMAAAHVWTFTTGTFLDTTAPTVTSTTPANAATAVQLNTPISATFSEPMAPTTLTTATFTLFEGATAVPGTVTYTGVTAIFSPRALLKPTTTYTARITVTATDLAGNPLASPAVWSFTTGILVDTVAPRVIWTNPIAGATNTATNTTVTATFNEVMAPATLTTASFTLKKGNTAIAGTVIYAAVTATFKPTVALEPDTTYTATIASTVTDAAGNLLDGPYVWTFTTGAVTDTVGPRVTFTVPADNAENVATNSDIAVAFTEAMDPTTLTTASFMIQELGEVVPGTVSFSNVTAVFRPTIALAPNTVYAAVVTSQATDVAGNPLVRNYTWNFKTGGIPDTTGPQVILTVPANLATNVTLDTAVSATFNSDMAPLSFTSTTFKLSNALGPVLGTVTELGDTAVFTPNSLLTVNTLYTATITTGVTDLAGNALAQDYVWTFTTGIALDLAPPTIIMTAPEDLEIDVPINTTVSATFDMDMDPLTVNTATFMLTGPGESEILGTVRYDALTMIATFSPSMDLMPDTEYTATVTVDVTDLAGIPMENDYVWTFFTGSDDTLAPGAINLRSLATFVAVAGAGLTNSNSSGITTLNGNVGLTPTATCMGDGSPCTLTNPVINGTLYANDPGGVAAKAKVDLTAAYVEAMSRPPGVVVSDLAGMTLAPGVYTSTSSLIVAVGGMVTLDGQGDSNAVWIFQIGSSLTVNNNAQILLINGAKAKNVFWAAFASSTIGSNVDFKGTVMAGASNSVGTDSTVLGRLLCTTCQITLLSNTITLP